MECFQWTTEDLQLNFILDANQHIWLQSITFAKYGVVSAPEDVNQALPLAQVRLAGEGSILGTSQRIVYSALSHRLIYVGRNEHQDAQGQKLEVITKDPTTGIQVVSQFSAFSNVPVLRCTTIITNNGAAPVFLDAVLPLSLGGLNGHSKEWWKEYRLILAYSTWLREAQWRPCTLPELGLDNCGASDFNQPGTRAAVIVSNQGTFSTTGHLPVGALERNDGRQCWMWQIEHSGAWRWELGNVLETLYVVAGGPTGAEQWTRCLAPGESFTSVPVALTLVEGNHEEAFGSMTEYRRRIRRPHADNESLPIIFNDYMNCLMGDPNEEKVEALIQPAKDAGAEYFVIDAGWYADDNGWWDTVGAWEPSKVRFPKGLKSLLNKIRQQDMIPGLWLEPEVIGVNSPVAHELPDDAFFQRYGTRVVEQGRYQLDFRHPSVRSRLDNIVDGLINEYGVGYFKLDYNIDVTQGTDANSTSPGDGMFEHRRAYISWINDIYDRFPDVVLETCSSGAQRLDYHMLATHSIQSTSDQQDALLYAAISASLPTAVTPEQSASWAYPQASWSDEKIVFTIVNSLLGRVHLSGHLDELSDSQLQIVKEGMLTYKEIRQDIKHGIPFWPLGLPEWHQDWLALGLNCGGRSYLSVWRRGGGERCSLPIQGISSTYLKVDCIFPKRASGSAVLDAQSVELIVEIPSSPAARLFCLS